MDTKLTEDDFIVPEEQQAFSAMKKIMLGGGELDLLALKHDGNRHKAFRLDWKLKSHPIGGHEKGRL